MEVLPPQLSQLAVSLQTLPGVGSRSAMRMALHLVFAGNRPKANQLAQDILAVSQIGMCHRCRHYASGAHCQICTSTSRDNSLLCVVESPTDLVAIESSGGYKGKYFVLHGKLSPIDGTGPEQLGFDLLESLVTSSDQNAQSDQRVQEVILALGTTVEGHVTCHYLQRRLQPLGIKVTRPAQGIPAGGNVEMLDSITLGQALQSRIEFAAP